MASVVLSERTEAAKWVRMERRKGRRGVEEGE